MAQHDRPTPPVDPIPRIKRQGNGFRAYTENGCVFAATRQEAIQKHKQRMANRRKKGWPVTGRRRSDSAPGSN